MYRIFSSTEHLENNTVNVASIRDSFETCAYSQAQVLTSVCPPGNAPPRPRNPCLSIRRDEFKLLGALQAAIPHPRELNWVGLTGTRTDNTHLPRREAGMLKVGQDKGVNSHVLLINSPRGIMLRKQPRYCAGVRSSSPVRLDSTVRFIFPLFCFVRKSSVGAVSLLSIYYLDLEKPLG